MDIIPRLECALALLHLDLRMYNLSASSQLAPETVDEYLAALPVLIKADRFDPASAVEIAAHREHLVVHQGRLLTASRLARIEASTASVLV